ncbi:MAG: CpsD/CapB family tyrosine-protein kinase [Bacillota bacterium]
MPALNRKGPRQNGHELVTREHPKSAIAEAYRTLRTNLGFTSPDRALRLLLVTSSGPEEGKTTTVCNLAVVLAQAGHRVLLVDCDLRKPRVHHVFSLPNLRGFTNLLLQEIDLGEVLKPGPVDGLSILTSGPLPPNPAELLDSQRARALWPVLAGSFDYVLVDSPPVLAVADATILATSMDGVILVIRAGITRIDAVQNAVEQLKRADARLIGTVLNRVSVQGGDYRYYYYYHGESTKQQQQQIQL